MSSLCATTASRERDRSVLRSVVLLLCLLLSAMLLCGCEEEYGVEDNPEETGSFYYAFDVAAKKLVRRSTEFTGANASERIDELLSMMVAKRELSEDKTEISANRLYPSDIVMVGWDISPEGDLTVTLEGEYSELSRTREALLRAGLVLTMCQLPEVGRVRIRIGEETLVVNQKEIGFMQPSDFVRDIGAPGDIVTIKLCFVNDAKKDLVTIDRIFYPDDYKPREQYCLETLFSGPLDSENNDLKKGGKAINAIPEGTKIIDVTTKGGICYVNLSKEFQTNDKTVAGHLVLHSVADTLILSFDYIDKVVISVEGKHLRSYRGEDVPSALTVETGTE